MLASLPPNPIGAKFEIKKINKHLIKTYQLCWNILFFIILQLQPSIIRNCQLFITRYRKFIFTVCIFFVINCNCSRYSTSNSDRYLKRNFGNEEVEDTHPLREHDPRFGPPILANRCQEETLRCEILKRRIFNSILRLISAERICLRRRVTRRLLRPTKQKERELKANIVVISKCK